MNMQEIAELNTRARRALETIAKEDLPQMTPLQQGVYGLAKHVASYLDAMTREQLEGLPGMTLGVTLATIDVYAAFTQHPCSDRIQQYLDSASQRTAPTARITAR